MRIMISALTLLASAAFMPVFAMADEGGAGGAGGEVQTPQPTVETKTVLKQNGIKRPDAGSVTGKLWDIADEESAKLGAPAPRKAVVDRYMKEQPGANNATANTQYARWVTYNGASEILKQNRAKTKEEGAAAKEAEKAAKQAEKQAAKDAKAKEKADAKAVKDAEKAAAAAKKAGEKAAADAAKKAADEKAAADKAAADQKVKDEAAKAEAKAAKK